MTPEERITYLQSFLAIDPKDSFTNFAIAQEYRKLGELEKVLAIYEKLLVDDPNYVGVYYHLGKLYQEIDRIPEAEKTFKEGIEVARKQGDLHARSELQAALMEVQGIGWD